MVETSPLVDRHGKPLRRELLEREIAGPAMSGVRSVLSGHPASGINPQRMASILRSAESGNAIAYFELAEQMEENDLHYLSVISTRKRAVSQLPMTVEPAGDSEEEKLDAKIIEDWLDRDTLEAETFDILDAIGKGVSYTEMIWGPVGDLYLPVEMKWRHPQWFEFDRVDGETPRLRDDDGMLVDLEPMKFIRHVHPAKSGLPVRSGLARVVAWGWMFKNYAIKDWVSFLEMFGQPIRVGRFDPGAHEDDVRKLMRAVSQVGSDAAAVYPRTMDIEFINRSAGTAPNQLWGEFSKYIDDQVSKAVIGQTSSADAKASGIGSGQSDLHGEVRDDIARADGKCLAATLNRDVVPWIISWNRGPRARYPRIKIAKPDAVDVKAMVESAAQLAALGVEIDAEEMRELAGLPAPKSAGASRLLAVAKKAPQEPLEKPTGSNTAENKTPAFFAPLRGQKTPSEQSSDRAKTASALAGDQKGAGSAPDPIDRLTDELLGDWGGIFEELMTPIEQAVASASSGADVQKRLAGMLETMDPAAFTVMMERAGFASYMAGQVDVDAEHADDTQ